jgi:glycosyltransferase involved in cell wall biosynthesis
VAGETALTPAAAVSTEARSPAGDPGSGLSGNRRDAGQVAGETAPAAAGADQAPMRILHLLAETGFSGGELQLQYLLEHLCRQGHENVLVLPPGARFREVCARLGVPARDAELRKPWRPSLFSGLRSLVRELRPDVLHFGCGRSLLWGGLLTLGQTAPLRVTTRRIDYPIGRLWRGIRYRRFVDHVVVNCEAVRQRVLAAGVPPDRVTLVHEGIDPRPFQGLRAQRQAARARLGIPADARVVSCPATLRPRKGQRDLIAAFQRLLPRHPGALLVLAGEGEDRAALADLVEKLGLAGRILLPGAIRPVQDLYAASDLVALASRHEGLANACLEASASGLPLVVTSAGGLPEIVADGVTGAVVPIGDVAALAAAIGSYLADPGLGAEAGRAGAARTLDLFDRRRMAEKMETLFLDLLRARHVPTA